MSLRAAASLALLAAALFSAGCRARRAPAPAVPARPVRAFVPPPPIVPAAVVLAEPETSETQTPVSVLPPPPLPSAFPRVPPPPRPARRRPAAKPGPEETAAPETPAEPAPAVRLGEVIPRDLARQLERRLAADSAAARQVLERIRGRRLSRDQADLAARIRAFLRQADQMRASDLSAAAELSRRAALLAQELGKTLR